MICKFAYLSIWSHHHQWPHPQKRQGCGGESEIIAASFFRLCAATINRRIRKKHCHCNILRNSSPYYSESFFLTERFGYCIEYIYSICTKGDTRPVHCPNDSWCSAPFVCGRHECVDHEEIFPQY
uniref:Uncharacterized protein n=1 Tax=Romanomermis culicivorax TaxID=13658 RepID=A0A915JWG8_ROMCU